MPGRLQGHVAVITGAGRGVGAAYARALASEGAAIVVNDRSLDPARAVVEEIVGIGGAAIADDSDIADFAAAGRLAEAAQAAFGHIDILVANAGVMRPGWLHETSYGDFRDVFAVHLEGTFNCYRQIVPRMIARGEGGTVIMTGAAIGEGDPARVGLGKGSHPGLGSYRAAKAAIAVLAIHAAGEVAQYGINVNAIMPGATSTEMQQHYYASLADSGVSAQPLDAGWPVASPADSVPPLGVFLCTAEGRAITGKTFQLNDRGIFLPVGATPKVALEPDAPWWTVEELAVRLPSRLDR